MMWSGKIQDQDKELIISHFEEILNSSYDGFWILDDRARVMWINDAAEKINDIKRSEILGKKAEDLLKDGLMDQAVTPKVLDTGKVVTLVQKLKNGKSVLVTGNPIFDRTGKISLVVLNDRDISELNRLRNKLEKHKFLTGEYRMELKRLEISKLTNIIAGSKEMQQILETGLRVAETEATILLQGESGVGKSHFAKLIHEASRRNNGPFICVDCGAIPESLIETELFGFERGAFTGANRRGKPGRFELADQGTLFLDEVGELPFKLQVKVLRFIEEKKMSRIGGISVKKIDTRIIAATNKNIEEMVKEKLFRKDLFFRLNVIPLTIPPLRERTEDIPLFVGFFLEKFNNKYSTKKTINREVIDCLCNYQFPGNIRELANLIERLVILSPTNEIDLGLLPYHILNSHTNMEFDEWPDNTLSIPNAMEKIEKEMIIKGLEKFGSQRKAARALGIDQSTLSRKVRRYKINMTS